MANRYEHRFWFVVASFPDGSRECESGLLTYTQARKLLDAIESVGMVGRIEEWSLARVKRSAA